MLKLVLLGYAQNVVLRMQMGLKIEKTEKHGRGLPIYSKIHQEGGQIIFIFHARGSNKIPSSESGFKIIVMIL